MLLCFVVALVLFIIAGISHWRAPSWPYHGSFIAIGLAFLTAALGFEVIKTAFR